MWNLRSVEEPDVNGASFWVRKMEAWVPLFASHDPTLSCLFVFHVCGPCIGRVKPVEGCGSASLCPQPEALHDLVQVSMAYKNILFRADASSQEDRCRLPWLADLFTLGLTELRDVFPCILCLAGWQLSMNQHTSHQNNEHQQTRKERIIEKPAAVLVS